MEKVDAPMFKRALLVVISLLAAATFVGCGSANSSQAKEIDVVGLPLQEACSKLDKAGWEVMTVDDSPYSDYVPGGYENGDTRYADKPVTKVEFQPSQSAGRGYVTAPNCKVHFKSGDETRLENDYDFDYEHFRIWYDKFSTALAEQGPTEELLSDMFAAYEDVLAYDPDKIPTSRKDEHQRLVEDYSALLGIPIESNTPAGAISWEEASSHIGERVSVCGEVKDWEYRSGSNGRPTYIDMGTAYPNRSRVTIVIWEEDRDAFPGILDNTGYVGKTVCVTGEIYEYEGVCYIKAESPSQIEVLE